MVQQMFLNIGRGGTRRPLPEPVDHPEAGASMIEQRVRATLRCSFPAADDVVAGLRASPPKPGPMKSSPSRTPMIRGCASTPFALGDAWNASG